MPRLPRFLLFQSCYHIITRGNNKNVIFREKEDYLYFLNLIKKYKKEHPFDLYHYCLMPNHVHLLIQTNKSTDFSVLMKKLNLSYYHYFRKKYGWTGHFWQNRFKNKPVGKDEYFIQCGKYIELNPVRANITKKPQEYPYSSYGYYAQGKENELLTDDSFYQGLGKDKKERQINYQKLTISQIIKKTYSEEIWGSNSQKYMEKRKIERKLSQHIKND
ncbi:MAG: transposase [bacterium]|nr:transposase [bacterium]